MFIIFDKNPITYEKKIQYYFPATMFSVLSLQQNASNNKKPNYQTYFV